MRVLFQGDSVILGETRIGVADPAFRREGVAGVWPNLAFPRRPVGIHLADRDPVLGDLNTVLLFPVGRPYRRISVAGSGSWTEWIEVRPDALEEMRGSGRAAGEGFFAACAPVPNRAYLLHRKARLRLCRGEGDAMEIEESALAVVEEVLRAGGSRAAGRAGASRRGLVLAVREVLNARLAEALSLGKLGAEIGASPWYLCHVFRDEVGIPIHRYRTSLRLRAALGRIADRNRTILDIATELGFSSEAQLSNAFRRAFGIRPSVYRRLSTGRPRTGRRTPCDARGSRSARGRSEQEPQGAGTRPATRRS